MSKLHGGRLGGLGNSDACNALWRVAMSAITSYFVLNITSSFLKGFFGQMSNGGLISFGKFDDASYNFFQLIIFAAMGVSSISIYLFFILCKFYTKGS